MSGKKTSVVEKQLLVSPSCQCIIISQTEIHFERTTISDNSQTDLCEILIKAYQDCFQKWQRRWEWCISAEGEYFEDDKAHSVAGMSKKSIKNSSKTL
jgi:hypothetical protein